MKRLAYMIWTFLILATTYGGEVSSQSAMPTVRKIVVETDLFSVEVDTYGGDLRKLRLLSFPTIDDAYKQSVQVLNESYSTAFVINGGLLSSGQKSPNHHSMFNSRATKLVLEDGQDKIELVLDWSAYENIQFRKIYTFYRDSYFIDLRFEVENLSTSVWKGHMYNQIVRNHSTKDDSGLGLVNHLRGYRGGVIYTNEKQIQKIKFDELLGSSVVIESTAGWVGVLQHDLAAILIPQGKRYQFYTQVTGSDTEYYIFGYKSLVPTYVDAGQTGSLRARFYVGPSIRGRLARDQRQLELIASVDAERVTGETPEKPRTKLPTAKLIGTGTGFLVNKNYIVTANHVLDGCNEVTVRHNHKEYFTVLAARDVNNDLGLLRLDTPLKKWAKLRGSRPIRLGEVIATYGYPLFGELSDSAKITQGNINSLAGIGNDSRTIQFDAPTQPGNSGGPVLDSSGNVVGVVSHGLSKKYADQSGHIAQNVNFAVKSYLVEGFLSSNNVSFEKYAALITQKLELPDIAEKAEKFTVLVGCWE